ncbi:phosphatase PAP2 family protein [Telluribacter sp. SYSU D00476]|uniref:phosphatase PAP2 family protein n=1 Tax=Telluribacter sp. SYSU D00476 TaxID=2811430 RepID=UPI001FF350A2|nr:phosphatase PAP2 family protein [Telluribacter sp. SYSU D00476]
MTSAIEALVQADQQLFLALNGLHTPWADRIMEFFTYKFTWIPMYLFLIYVLVREFRKQSIGILLTIIAAIGLADQIASGLFKPYFARLRPCHDPEIGSLVHVVDGCGGQYGFVSSHAATAFALALSVQVLTGGRLKGAGWLYLWAVIYSFSRIYVGVHYPADITVGALVGILSGAVCILIYKNVLQQKLS